MMEPTFRCGSAEAIDKLAKKLNLSPVDWSMQDWSYTAGSPDDIEKYISLYDSTTDEDEKFVLMELIIQAIEDQEKQTFFAKYCNIIKPVLEKEFNIHEYTIYYWSCLDTEDLNDCWNITPLMRQLWWDKRKLKLLFVCTINRMRSATAHKIYENDGRFHVKSAGTDKTADTVLTDELLN